MTPIRGEKCGFFVVRNGWNQLKGRPTTEVSSSSRRPGLAGKRQKSRELAGFDYFERDLVQFSMGVLAGDSQCVEGLLFGNQLGSHQNANCDSDVAVAFRNGRTAEGLGRA